MSDQPWELADKVESWVCQAFTSYIGKREGLVTLLADALADARREGANEATARVEALVDKWERQGRTWPTGFDFRAALQDEPTP